MSPIIEDNRHDPYWVPALSGKENIDNSTRSASYCPSSLLDFKQLSLSSRIMSQHSDTNSPEVSISSSMSSSLPSTSSTSLLSSRTFYTRDGLINHAHCPTVNLDFVRESSDAVDSMSAHQAHLPTTQQQADPGRAASSVATVPSPFLSLPSSKLHPSDPELSNRCCSSSRGLKQSQQGGCHSPELYNFRTMRMPGSDWRRLLVVALLALTCSGVQSLPLAQQSETEQAYRKLQLNTVVSFHFISVTTRIALTNIPVRVT